MTESDVTPPRKRLSRKATLWIAISAAAVVVLLVILAVVWGSSARPGATSASPSPTPGQTSPAPEDSASPSASGTPGASAAPTPDPQPTTPVTPGAPVPAPTAPPVAIDEPATPAPGVTVAVTAMEAIQGEATRAGDVAGPAIRFVVTVTNTTGQPVSLATALVNVYYGADATPANELSSPGGSPLPQEAAAGGSAAGTFIFTIPEDERDNVLITLDYQVGTPVIAFEGAVP